MWIGADTGADTGAGTDGEGNDSLSHVIATELSTSGIPVEAVETVEVSGKTFVCLFVFSNWKEIRFEFKTEA